MAPTLFGQRQDNRFGQRKCHRCRSRKGFPQP
jgi:hypothetical protein